MTTNLEYTLYTPDYNHGVAFLEHTQVGQAFDHAIANNFISASDVINHTQPLDHESVVHFVNGDSFAINLPKRTFAAAVRTAARYFGFPQ